MSPCLKDAYQLFHDGSLALSRIEANGVRVDVPYFRDKVESVGLEIRALEDALKKDEVWKVWSDVFGGKANLNSRQQLGQIIFHAMGHPSRAVTESGQDSTEESAFRGIGLPFIPEYFHYQKLQKLRKTYLLGVLREVGGDGVLHPVFNLHTVQTYRSSSDSPNFQNLPTRDPILGKVIRDGFLPYPGEHLVEVDLSGAEVRVAYCYHQDPTMREYLCDPSTDMHRDTAADLLKIPVQFLKDNAAWAKKTCRDWAKNRFVFPQFYGSVYFQCAPHIWEVMSETTPEGKPKYAMPDGRSFLDHLADNGIRALGECNPKVPPLPGTFEHHVKKVERSFWDVRFPVYTEWRRRWLSNYESLGYFDLLTGFRCHGMFQRNQVINYPVQGAAFHVLLWSLIRIQRWLQKYRMRARLVGQIHDSLIASVPPDELQDYLTAVRHTITVACPRHWGWISIPLEIEAEVCGVDRPWSTKQAWVERGGIWGPK